MKRLLWILVLLCAGCSAASSATPPRSEGEEQYTPTKIEWLALQCNATHRDIGSSRIVFGAKPGTNTIFINAMSTSSEDAQANIAVARVGVETIAKQHGWAWVKIEAASTMIP